MKTPITSKSKWSLIIAAGLVLLTACYLIVFRVVDKNQVKNNLNEGSINPDTIVMDTAQYKYGLRTDTFQLTTRKIRSGQFFSQLINGYQLNQADVMKLVELSDSIFNIKKLKAGNTFTLITTRDTVPVLCYFIYDINPFEYLVFKTFDSMEVYTGRQPVDTVIRTVSGVIQTSLWVDMYKNGASPLLINKLSDVYAWEIDFFRIQKEDKFKLVYEDILINGKSASIGKVLTAVFNHEKHDHFAFLYDQDDREDYFDENGDCLRKMLLKAPLNFKRISSRFTSSRFHPVLKRYRPHYGVDYAAATGTPVHSVGDGEVIYAAYSGGGGNMVKVRHNGSYTTGYMHLSRYGKGIRKGVKVKQGQVIGYVGSTGLATGPHLDYRIWKSGQPVNPLTLDLPPVESVKEQNMEEFKRVMLAQQALLDKIPYKASEEANFSDK